LVRKSSPKGGTHAERIKRERGAGRSAPRDPDHLSSDEMLDWLRHEVLAVTKEAELRIRDVTTMVTEYARGTMTAEEANKRFLDYGSRWGDALNGVSSPEGRTDDQILREMDEDRQARMRAHREGGTLDKPPSR
jgi:hypothetical protein